MSRVFSSILACVAISAAAVVSGCASGPRTEPVVGTVCLDLPGMPPAEAEFVAKRAGTYLAEHGYTLAPATPCDATARFQQLGQFQGEVMPGLFRAGSATGAWRGW